MIRGILLSILVYGAVAKHRTNIQKRTADKLKRNEGPDMCDILIAIGTDTVFGCYYNKWSEYRGLNTGLLKNVDPFLCTHLFYCFARIERGVLTPYEWNDESTEWSKGMFEQFNDLKLQNPALKTLLSVGGWTLGSKGFTEVVDKASTRKIFIDHAIEYLRKWKFDGLDLHWQYPGLNWRKDDLNKRWKNKALFTTFCAELKAAFYQDSSDTKRERLLLTAAVAADKDNMDAGYEIDKIHASLDWINLMSYDLRGPWEPVTGHHTTTRPSPEDDADTQLLTVEWAVNEWIKRGTPANKLVLGMATYGRAFTLAGSGHGVNAPANGTASKGRFTDEPGRWAYYEICDHPGFTVVEDEVRQITYAYSNTEWVGYEDVNSLDKKGAIIQELGLRGGMAWSLDLDDFRGIFCHQGTWPLIKKMKSMVLGGDYRPSTPPTTVTPMPFTTSDPKTPTTAPTMAPTTRDQQIPTTAPTMAPTTRDQQNPTTVPIMSSHQPHEHDKSNPDNPCADRRDGEMVEAAPCSSQFYHCSEGQIVRTRYCVFHMVFNERCGCCEFSLDCRK